MNLRTKTTTKHHLKYRLINHVLDIMNIIDSSFPCQTRSFNHLRDHLNLRSSLESFENGTFLTAPESQQPAYVSGEFHERNHPALSSQISHKKYLKKGLGQCEHVCNIGTIDTESAGIFWWFSPLPERQAPTLDTPWAAS